MRTLSPKQCPYVYMTILGLRKGTARWWRSRAGRGVGVGSRARASAKPLSTSGRTSRRPTHRIIVSKRS